MMILYFYISLCCFWMGVRSTLHLYEKMSENERRFYLDQEDGVPPHHVIFIKDNYLRQNSSVLLIFKALEELFHLKLRKNDKLLTSDFTIRETTSRNRADLTWDANDTCLYEGKSKYHLNSRVAVSLCDGVRGIIQIENGIYIIQPLSANLIKKMGWNGKRGKPHLVVRKQQNEEYFCPHAARKRNAQAAKNPVYNVTGMLHHRYIRSPSPPDPTIETAVFIDQPLYENLKIRFPVNSEQQIIKYILTMMNAVQILFRQPSLGHMPEIKLVELNILKTQPEDLESSENIDTYLTNFCIWQLKKRKKSRVWWDHALLLSGINMYVIDELGRRKKHVVGLAPVSGMCNPLNSCTISEGTSFQTVLVVGHEFGHSMGMEHDGRQDDNHCDPEKYIMSHTLGPGKTSWSTCSREYLEKFLRSSQSRCLQYTNSGVNMLKKLSPVLLPGQEYDANKQCQLRYGEGSRKSTIQSSEDICYMLRCDVGFGGKDVSFTAHPALEGTVCGRNKMCQAGKCTTANWRRNRAGPVDGGWSAWSNFGPCSSDCSTSRNTDAVGVMISTRRCNNPRPVNGGRYCQGADRRVRICDANRICSAAANAVTLSEYISETCQQASHLDTTLDPSGTQFPSHDNSHSCYVWCHKKQGGYITHGWKLPDGTPCWRGYHPQNQFCFQGKCNTFDCNGYTIETSNETPCPNRPTLATRHITEWSPWKKISECKHSCIVAGKGFTLVSRKCNTVTGCTGVRDSFQLCDNNSKCTVMKSAEVYATDLCKKYRNRYPTVLSGKGRQLAPRSGNPHAACTVACQDQVWQGTHYQMDAFEDGKFPSGTDCSGGNYRKKAYCLNGKCVEFDENNVPKVEDNNSILQVKKLFKYYRHRRDTSEQENSVENLFMNNKYAIDQNKRKKWIKYKLLTQNFHKYTYRWAIEMSECSEPCGGGIRNVSMFCVRENVPVESAYCESIIKPMESGIQECNMHPCVGKWQIRHWTPCSVTCGNGTRTRYAICVQQLTEDLYSFISHINCPKTEEIVEKCEMPKCS
ncbi:A disintegrin and metalloproteinase with thrombospondin motifs 6-like isoform X2 [Centruroides sculpturatus]|uniref:A disintegrin and metalloproteinase with thrombospondin motifs 6-like isoform X2 n=1 Tax=Centruroides sculpturatus TaxID=218467 RepID=UPI000C6CFC2F|nr:A disintegrin and metalloproteinase with thrombospondin motifs 6-like isoform X2 [Centruroides sculpturatus]